MNLALTCLSSRVAGKPSPVQITHTEAVYNCGALPWSATPAELINAGLRKEKQNPLVQCNEGKHAGRSVQDTELSLVQTRQIFNARQAKVRRAYLPCAARFLQLHFQQSKYFAAGELTEHVEELLI